MRYAFAATLIAAATAVKQDLDQVNANFDVESYEAALNPGLFAKEHFKSWWSETARPFYMQHYKAVEAAAKAKVIEENENWWSLTCD